MLQQTRVEAVMDYYRRFLDALPDIPSLAAAPEETVLKLWQGLGYYSRARSLQKAARQVMDSYGGIMPGEVSELRKLAGIGDYTAAAIASIAFGRSEPAVDGNLLRIYARADLVKDNIRTPAALRAADAYYRERIPADRPGDFNQALMDLGARICTPAPRRPDCGNCPWKTCCRSYAADPSGDTAVSLPVMPEKKARRRDRLTVLLLYAGDRVLLHRRPARGLLAGLYEFPNLPGDLEEREVLEALRERGMHPVRIRPAGCATHVFTHREWEMKGYEVWLAEGPIPDSLTAVSRDEIENRYPIPSAFSYYVEKIASIVV